MCDKNEILHAARVQAVLQEVQYIRQEVLDNISRMHKLEVGSITFFAGLAAFAWHKANLVPMLGASILTWLYVWAWVSCQRHADNSSLYLREEVEERKWPELLGSRNSERMPSSLKHREYWVGWQHYFDLGIPGAKARWVIPYSVWALGLLSTIAGIWGLELEATGLHWWIGLPAIALLAAALLALIDQSGAGIFARHRKAKEINVESKVVG